MALYLYCPICHHVKYGGNCNFVYEAWGFNSGDCWGYGYSVTSQTTWIFKNIFPFHKTFRPTLRPIHLLEWVPGAVSLGIKKAGGLNLTIYFCAVLSLIMYGVTPPLPQCTLIDWCLIRYWDTFTFASFPYCEFWGFLCVIFLIIILSFKISCFMMVNIHIVVFWFLIPCSLVGEQTYHTYLQTVQCYKLELYKKSL